MRDGARKFHTFTALATTDRLSIGNPTRPLVELSAGIDKCYHFRVQIIMGRWKRFGVVVVRYLTDHDLPHVHVFQDGKRILKFDIEDWKVMEGKMTSNAQKALGGLRREGLL